MEQTVYHGVGRATDQAIGYRTPAARHVVATARGSRARREVPAGTPHRDRRSVRPIDLGTLQ
ncbi:MAG TPA: hypothetical protein VGT98_10945, partial [Candidatus Elarobacter sp.]|nr:hypothetical protein [Candidatus Elarobacter sp.]